jgi:hypothetical protein
MDNNFKLEYIEFNLSLFGNLPLGKLPNSKKYTELTYKIK